MWKLCTGSDFSLKPVAVSYDDQTLVLSSEPLTFRGNVTVVYVEQPNPLIGPTRKVLVAFGALFPLCVREDHALNVQQVQGLYPHLGQDGEELGCCEFRKLNIAGTATEVGKTPLFTISVTTTNKRIFFLLSASNHMVAGYLH